MGDLAEFQEGVRHLSPLVQLALVMGAMFFIPKLVERFGIPGLIGLIFAGILTGPLGLGIFKLGGPVISVFAELGKLLLMFTVGHEVDLSEFIKRWRDSLTFGLLTFVIPFLLGATVALLFGYSLLTAALVGSLLASHTLLAFPLIQKAGLQAQGWVQTAIGATVMTDILAMLALAICLPIHKSGFSAVALGVQVLQILIFTPAVLLLVPPLFRAMLRRYGDSPEAQVALTMLVLTVVAEGAEMVHMEGIVGAFLAGIAVRRATGHAHLHEGMAVTARYTFIPSFFMATGMLIEPGSVIKTIVQSPWLTAAIIGSLLLGKYVAAWLSARLLRYPASQVPGMWALTTPQVAATLAAAVVASQTLNAAGVPLIDANLLNVVLVLVVVTAIGGPVVTQRLLQAAAPKP